MSAARLLNRAVDVSKVQFKRNIGLSAPALQKVSDPIQQLFIDKIREYKSKSSGGKLVEPTPEIEKEIKQELARLTKQYGSLDGSDVTKFPDIKFQDVKLDSVNLEE